MAHSVDNMLLKQVNKELRQIARLSKYQKIANRAERKRGKLKAKREEFYKSANGIFSFFGGLQGE